MPPDRRCQALTRQPPDPLGGLPPPPTITTSPGKQDQHCHLPTCLLNSLGPASIHPLFRGGRALWENGRKNVLATLGQVPDRLRMHLSPDLAYDLHDPAAACIPREFSPLSFSQLIFPVPGFAITTILECSFSPPLIHCGIFISTHSEIFQLYWPHPVRPLPQLGLPVPSASNKYMGEGKSASTESQNSLYPAQIERPQ